MKDLRRLVLWATAIAFAVLAARAVFSAPWSLDSEARGNTAMTGAASGVGSLASPETQGAPGSSLSAGAFLQPLEPGRARTSKLAIEDSDLVFGPRFAGFNTAAVIASHGGALAEYGEALDGSHVGSARIIDTVALDHSVSPALLLSFLELASGALTQPGPLDVPLGGTAVAVNAEGLRDAAGRIAAWLNDAYYAERYRGGALLGSQRGRMVGLGNQPSAAQTAVAQVLRTMWPDRPIEERLIAFAQTHGQLFGDLPARSSAPPIPDGLTQPPLLLPWIEGEGWHYTGGPHGSWGSGTAWGAIDFAPPSPGGCSPSDEWVIASAPGRVVSSREGQVLVDLDGDGLVQTGWVVLYQHMATSERVPVGTVLNVGDPIGHPSCEGGFATGSHLHYARRYDGEWLPATGGPVPLELSGWTFNGGASEYDGEMDHVIMGERVALRRRNGGVTAVVSDNGPQKRAELASTWASMGLLQTEAVDGTADGNRATLSTSSAAAAGRESDQAALASASALAGSITPGSGPTDPVAASGSPAPRLIVRLLLQGRQRHNTAFVVALERQGEPPIGLIGHTDESGLSNHLAMPHTVGGLYDVVLRAPGFTPARVIGAALEHGVVQIDFSGGGLTPLRAGDLNGDESVDASDVFAWFGARRNGRPSADLDGDGSAGMGDLVRLMLPAYRNG